MMYPPESVRAVDLQGSAWCIVTFAGLTESPQTKSNVLQNQIKIGGAGVIPFTAL